MLAIGVLAMIAAGTVLAVVWSIAGRCRMAQKEWVAECPGTETTAAITLDAAGGVTACSHWPERKHCDQRCVG